MPRPQPICGRFTTALLGPLVGSLIALGCAADDHSEPETLRALPDASPGDVVGLVAVDGVDGSDEQAVEWIDRLGGTIHRLQLDDASGDIETVATIEIGTDGEQRGLLGHVVVDGRRFASWTQPDTFELVVGEVLPDGTTRLIWSAGEAGSGAIGGVLDERDGRIVIGLGRNTAWDRDTGDGGAILTLDADGDIGQTPDVLSTGYTNPWAFAALDDGAVWVADNAAGPDPDDDSVDDIERIGRADLEPDRNEMTRIVETGRAPSAMVELPDGRIGICGFLDNELRAYEIVDSDTGPRTSLDRAGTIMPCLTGAAVFADGTIVTASLADPGVELTILRP